MHLLHEWRLLYRGSRSRLFSAQLGLTLLVFLISLAVDLGWRLRSFAASHLIPAAQALELIVETRKVELAYFQADDPNAPKTLDASIIREIGRIPGVSQLWPLNYARTPVAIEGSFLGQAFGGSVILQGFEPAWLAEEMEPQSLAWQEGMDLPVVLSTHLLALYNAGYAKSQGLPELSAKALLGRSFRLMLGRGGREIAQPCRIVALSKKVGVAICIPNGAFETLHQKAAGSLPTPGQLVLRMDSLSDVAAVREAVLAMGLAMQEPSPLVTQIVRLESSVERGGLWLSALAGLLALLLLHLSMQFRFEIKRRDFALCRAMGMSRRRLRLVILLETCHSLLVSFAVALPLAAACSHQLSNRLINPMLMNWTGFSLNAHLQWELGLVLAGGFTLLALAICLPPLFWGTRQAAGSALTLHR